MSYIIDNVMLNRYYRAIHGTTIMTRATSLIYKNDNHIALGAQLTHAYPS